MDKLIKPAKKLAGELFVPGDKSVSHRALMIGAIAEGNTMVTGLLDCDDCNYTMSAFRGMGVAIKKEGKKTIIEGKGLKGLSRPRSPINAGNSGTTIRLLAGILAGQDFEAALTGDEGILRRPMKRIVEPLSRMGIDITARDGEYPPLVIRGGKVRPIIYDMPIPSAQVKSAVLFAGLYPDGVTKITEKFKSRDHTERMLKYFGADVKVKGTAVSVKGGRILHSRDVEVPGDISSASFFLIGALLLKGSRVKIKNVSINPTRAGILKIISKMGGKIRITNKKWLFEPAADITAEFSKTKGIIIDKAMIPAIIDELPIIFVLAALSKGRTVIKGAEELKFKETDRINSMSENLAAMGAGFHVKGGDIIIDGVEKLKGASLKSFGDHRTCMAMTIAALAADGASSIGGIESVTKSFPGFFAALSKLI